jgi:hypothetical protein
MFADIGLGEPEFVGQEEGFAIFAQRLPPILVERMDRHGKETEIHGLSAPPWSRFCCAPNRARLRHYD